METFQSLLARKLSEALAKAGFPDTGELTPVTDARFGDYQANSALVLAKQLGQKPRDIAASAIEKTSMIFFMMSFFDCGLPANSAQKPHSARASSCLAKATQPRN